MSSAKWRVFYLDLNVLRRLASISKTVHDELMIQI